MSRTRTIPPTLRGRAGLAATLAAGLCLAAPAHGQEAAPELRLGTSPASSGSAGSASGTGAATRDLSQITAVAPSGASAATSGPTPPTGRPKKRVRRQPTRVPTAAAVHAEIRGPTLSPGVAVDVQQSLVGVPDPAAAPNLPRRPLPADDPYAPLGVRVGNVMLFPVIGESIGYDSNPDRIDRTLRKGSFVSQTEGELRIQSDWSRHELSGTLRGAYNEYPGVPEASRPEGAGRLGLRLDVERDTSVDLEAHYQLDTERFGSPDLNVVARERPIVNSEGGSVGVTERFNRLALTLRGTIDRTDYADAILGPGTVLDQSDRNYATYGARLRLAYTFSPAFVPFVEGLGDVRRYDQTFDRSGFRRSSDGVGARIGAAFELTRLVTGEIGAGAITRSYDDPRLKNLTSPLVDAALVWSATPLTTVRATGQVRVDETTVVGSNGVIASRASLEVQHDLRRNLSITPGFSVFENDYKGVPITERGYGASVKLDYRLTRSIAVRASYIFERLNSSFPGSDYTTNVFLVGLRLQP